MNENRLMMDYKKTNAKLRRINSAIWRHKYIWTIVAFVVIVGFVDANSFYRRFTLNRENRALEEEIKRYDDKYKADTRRIEQLRSDPDAIIKVARENHKMKSDDEDVYYIIDHAQSDSAAVEE